MRWLLLVLVLACIFSRLTLSLMVFPRRVLKLTGECTKSRLWPDYSRFVRRRTYCADDSTEVLPSVPKVVPKKHSIYRRIEVMLPGVEGVDLENLTDLILETCPDVLSLSVELVKEKSQSQHAEHDYNCNRGDTNTSNHDIFQTWESQVQGTSAWLSALLILHVMPPFQEKDLQQLLHSAFPTLVFAVSEPALKDGDLERDAEQDWILKVQQSWPPQRIGDLTVYFPWHNRSQVTKGDDRQSSNNSGNPSTTVCSSPKVELVLEGGAAFGTGDHPTTRLCVHWLSRLFSQASQKRNCTLLDYGCGSAILALAGLRFGASRAVGVDVDADAIRSAQRNCQLNGLLVDLYLTDPENGVFLNESCRFEDHLEASSLTMKKGLLGGTIRTSSLAGKFDVTVANIIAPVLILLAPKLAAYTKVGGRVALSGVLAFQAEAVISAYIPFFDNVSVEDAEGDWVIITGVRKKRQ